MNKKNILAVPYVLWAILFTIVPLFIVLLYSFTKRDAFGGMIFSLTFENYKMFFEPIYLNVLWRSLRLSLYSTIACFMIGYPMAYIISKSDIKKQSLMIMLFILPLWTNFLLRTYAWMVVLREQGALNELLLLLGIIDEPLQLLYTNGAVIMGMVYNFLPFMVLPIYSVLSKIDKSLLEAAQDLGANSFSTFIKVIFPLSFPGVASGVLMVFMPAISTFVISDLLGGGQTILLGNLIQNQFMMARNWQFGSAISMIMMVMIVLSMGYLTKHSSKEGGTGLW
ncbi:ABC transporter permease [Acetoanaerobium noterae]|jgi:spermidine/putrescine transport system permease protein|uniref:ABC transporter permease n=1 Tax=Acetoanaerobium noterae TaxID=745369 RepID=UPI001B4AA546|nr:ABC transporter permease [Acetoanaerobium noterae]MBP8762825.1 ABC transporter permease [Acetoanaerobium sp.]MBP9499813.1 ABC transporter permease [Acetoanaerobium sp.]MDK2803669.1 spermidine/putrescine transport system permease protein [Peptostreptococcaceae bacterium]